jgi:hypothetical protein
VRCVFCLWCAGPEPTWHFSLCVVARRLSLQEGQFAVLERHASQEAEGEDRARRFVRSYRFTSAADERGLDLQVRVE